MKRKYEKKVIPRLLDNKEFFIRHLRQEWAEAEKATKREDMVRAAKAGGIAFGKGLLTLLLVAGTLTVAAAAPNIFSAFGRMRGRRIYRTYMHSGYFQRELAVLKKQNFVSASKINKNEYEIGLTKLGEERAIQRAYNTFTILRPALWDGTWRIIVFDIPDTHKSAREGFREKLKAIGFYSLQRSVFVFPYPCIEELEFIISLYGVGEYVRLIEANHIVYDDDIRKYFAFN